MVSVFIYSLLRIAFISRFRNDGEAELVDERLEQRVLLLEKTRELLLVHVAHAEEKCAHLLDKLRVPRAFLESAVVRHDCRGGGPLRRAHPPRAGPTPPPAPGLSTPPTGCPSSVLRYCATTRAVRSVLPPAG